MDDFYFERKFAEEIKKEETGTTRVHFYPWEKEKMERFIHENHSRIYKWDFSYGFVDVYI